MPLLIKQIQTQFRRVFRLAAKWRIVWWTAYRVESLPYITQIYPIAGGERNRQRMDDLFALPIVEPTHRGSCQSLPRKSACESEEVLAFSAMTASGHRGHAHKDDTYSHTTGCGYLLHR